VLVCSVSQRLSQAGAVRCRFEGILLVEGFKVFWLCALTKHEKKIGSAIHGKQESLFAQYFVSL